MGVQQGAGGRLEGRRLRRFLGLGLCREPRGYPWLANLLLKFPAQPRDAPAMEMAGLWLMCRGEEWVLVCCWPSPPGRVNIIKCLIRGVG